MTRFLRVGLLVCAAVVLCFSPIVAEAAFLQSYSGNTNAGSSPLVLDATVNFAVLDRTANGNPDDPFGIGSTAFYNTFVPGAKSENEFDGSARYLYLYQVANNGDNNEEVSTVTVRLRDAAARESITSWGYFGGYGLQDDGGLVSYTNDFGTSGEWGAPAAANTGVTSPAVGTINDGVDPDPVRAGATGFRASFVDELVTDDRRSVIFGFTSNNAPTLELVQLLDGFGSASGYVASPVPSPTTVLGIIALLPVLAGIVVTRYRRLKSA